MGSYCGVIFLPIFFLVTNVPYDGVALHTPVAFMSSKSLVSEPEQIAMASEQSRLS